MGNRNACIRHLQEALSSLMSISSEPEELLTSPVSSETEHASTSDSPPLLCARSESIMGERTESGKRSVTEEQIENSKCHWSQLAELDSNSDEEESVAAEIGNVEMFKTLQMHPTWGGFFRTFGYDLGTGRGSAGELVVGEKFAEGGQAELYHAEVKWHDPKINEDDLKDGTAWVLKVFKKGTLLRHLQSQWPQGMFQAYAKEIELLPNEPLIYTCNVNRGVLLKDGRFAFLLVKETCDLRNDIDRCMKFRTGNDHGPFAKGDGEYIMYRIAQGMDWLHNHNIIHRDIKASNVLCRYKEYWDCLIADYECSVGVVGTGFWRAPEILQACKDKVVSSKPELFTKEADIYSYGMTCYEVLTGNLPFEGDSVMIDNVLSGQRPEVPKYVDNWARELLSRCWQLDPAARPTVGEILKLLSANSVVVRGVEEAESNPLWDGGFSFSGMGDSPSL